MKSSESYEQSELYKIRHTAAHILAMAALEFDPKVKLAIGPPIDNGFYYDFEFSKPISETDLPALEKSMMKIINKNFPVEHSMMDRAVAVKEITSAVNQPYKQELAENLTDEKLGFYTIDKFKDLCKGPHVKSTGEVKAFKLLSLAGAYWHGDEKNAMLTRIYGTAFGSKNELDAHLEQLAEAKKRDHRKLGKELELFALIDEVGPGLPLFYPKGAILRRLVEDYITKLQEKRGYKPIWIPHITKGELYEISGHLDKYDALYPPMELKGESAYYLKPMNCPHFMMLYKTQPHSYRELPIRWTCTTTNYRYEKSGELSGLTRVRSLTQDDCHIFCTPDQIEGEINLILDMISEIYTDFNLKDFWVRISTHDPANREKYIGDDKIWAESEASLLNLIKKRGWEYEIGVGEAAFYGPKLDFIFKDVIGREWQMSTVQLDMNLPKRFKLTYADQDGSDKQPVLIHRAILGSTERFLGIMIEHFGGDFPVWLAPVQAVVLPISEKFADYTKDVAAELEKNGFRFEIDDASETLGKRIRTAESQKIPYILVVGEKEAADQTVSVRSRHEPEQKVIKLTSLATLLDPPQ